MTSCARASKRSGRNYTLRDEINMLREQMQLLQERIMLLEQQGATPTRRLRRRVATEEDHGLRRIGAEVPSDKSHEESSMTIRCKELDDVSEEGDDWKLDVQRAFP